VADRNAFEEPKGNPLIQWGMTALGVIAAIMLAWYLYTAITGTHGVKVAEVPPQTINMLPPPPPPPPPPKPQEKPPEPTDAPKPTPEAPAAPKQDAPAPMTQNAPAQAGSDSYGLQAGGGGGMGAPGGTGTCVGPNCGAPPGGGISDAFYARSLSSALQQRVQADRRVNREVFSADFAVWINGTGKVTRADIVKSSNDGERDQVLRDLLLSANGLTPPPATFKFPRRISVSGKKAI
jgi:type IV secretory pathway VirB10-like protein